MAVIYANAFEVLLWLGAEADGSGEAMEAINSGAGSMRQYESEVQSLFRRPYWNRLWILQEILMAQNISVICGDQVFAWETLEAHFIPQIPRGIEINISWEEHPVEIDKVALSLIEERASFGGANQRLSYILENFAILQCGDVRDKVYGLLSLVRRSGVIPVDYTITEDNVFFNALRKIVEDESYIETENHFFVGRHLRDTMMLVHISDAEIFVCIKKEIRKADSKDKPDQTLLDWAVNNGNEGMVKVLLEDGADINAANEDRETPLYQASSEGHVEVIKLLLEKGADIQIANIWGDTPLHQAWKVEIVKLLLKKGADINAADKDRETPLHQASSRGKVEIVKLLLEKGADINVVDLHGRTPLYWASDSGLPNVVKLLHEKGADINVDRRRKHGLEPEDKYLEPL